MSFSKRFKCMMFLVAGFGLFQESYAQTEVPQSHKQLKNPIVTAVPFLLIVPDARTSGMGDAGVAVAGDANSGSINPAKLVFLPYKYGFSFSYTPWLKALAPDVNLAYLSSYYKLNPRNTLAASLRYFSLGQIQLTDEFKQDQGIAHPHEMAIDVVYARSFGAHFSLGGGIRYTYSNLTDGQYISRAGGSPGSALSVDISALYKTPLNIFKESALFALGAYVSNIGGKMHYATERNAYYMPANLKLGSSTTFMLDAQNQLTWALDFNKLLVPTPPYYNAQGEIIKGRNPNRSIPSAIFGSFSDAPNGFSEELKEINLSSGIEYFFKQQFALRAGYSYQSPEKGDRNYFTLGAGIKYQTFNIDFSYLLANTKTNPLANALRFSMLFNFGTVKTQ